MILTIERHGQVLGDLVGEKAILTRGHTGAHGGGHHRVNETLAKGGYPYGTFQE